MQFGERSCDRHARKGKAQFEAPGLMSLSCTVCAQRRCVSSVRSCLSGISLCVYSSRPVASAEDVVNRVLPALGELASATPLATCRACGKPISQLHAAIADMMQYMEIQAESLDSEEVRRWAGSYLTDSSCATEHVNHRPLP